jgi:hypothetical protein
MAHFAKINSDNIVEEVIVIDNNVLDDGTDTENEQQGIDFIINTLGLSGTWKQTSYNGNLRANYAGIGYTYDATNDVFYEEQPAANMSLNTTTWKWETASE